MLDGTIIVVRRATYSKILFILITGSTISVEAVLLPSFVLSKNALLAIQVASDNSSTQYTMVTPQQNS